MQPLNLHINRIHHRNKNHFSWFLCAIYLVLTLFIAQLLISPLTFSNWWHCPMMSDAEITASMDMENCMHMQDMTISRNTKQDHHKKSQHGMVLCPLCTSFALPSPLLSNAPELPAISVIIIVHQIKFYFGQAPTTKLIQGNSARAPPSFRF